MKDGDYTLVIFGEEIVFDRDARLLTRTQWVMVIAGLVGLAWGMYLLCAESIFFWALYTIILSIATGQNGDDYGIPAALVAGLLLSAFMMAVYAFLCLLWAGKELILAALAILAGIKALRRYFGPRV